MAARFCYIVSVFYPQATVNGTSHILCTLLASHKLQNIKDCNLIGSLHIRVYTLLCSLDFRGKIFNELIYIYIYNKTGKNFHYKKVLFKMVSGE